MKLKALLAAAIAVAIGAAATATAQQNRQLSIVTGGTGGVYYPLGGGFGNILGKELPGVTATAQVTGGSVANLQLIGSGKVERSARPIRRPTCPSLGLSFKEAGEAAAVMGRGLRP